MSPKIPQNAPSIFYCSDCQSSTKNTWTKFRKKVYKMAVKISQTGPKIPQNALQQKEK